MHQEDPDMFKALTDGRLVQNLTKHGLLHPLKGISHGEGTKAAPKHDVGKELGILPSKQVSDF